MQNATPAAIAVLVLELVPAAVFGLAGERPAQACARWPSALRTAFPIVFVLPYILISSSHQMFSWGWCALYAALPAAIAWLLGQAAIGDPEQHGNWRDAIILLTLGMAVDLRWFDRAWPSGLAGWGKLLLVDAGLYGFLAECPPQRSLTPASMPSGHSGFNEDSGATGVVARPARFDGFRAAECEKVVKK